MQSGAALAGCTLVYQAVQADHAYRGGDPVVISGHIALHQFGAEVVMGLKIGIRELGQNAPMSRPAFAYLQTKTASTVRATKKVRDGEDGYRSFAIGLGKPSNTVLAEMLDEGKVTLGFNRKQGGKEVRVPLDLRVYDAERVAPATFRRKRSDDAVAKFISCMQTLLKQTLTAPAR